MPPLMFSIVNHSLDRATVVEALLQHQFFPNVKPVGEELPPLFTSESFTPPVATELASVKLGPRKYSTDYVMFRARRFDGLVRRLGVPHPVTYARLINHIGENWGELCEALQSPESMIQPSRGAGVGRIISMDYGSPAGKAVRATRAAQSKRYMVKADISNCFPSLYSHSIDWALRGFEEAKKTRASTKTWQAQLDQHVRNCHDGETKGLVIGPAVSNLLSEVVLQQIDEQLRKRFEFIRFIDDYTAYFKTLEDAEEFVADLDRQLSSYRLVLNTRKTKIHSLQGGFGEPWINDINSHLPKTRGAVAAIRFLQHCESLAQQNPDQSVLLYGVKTLLSRRGCPRLGETSKRSPKASRELPVLDEMVRINFFHPHLSCFLVRQMAFVSDLLSESERIRLVSILREQFIEAVRRAETDTITWLIYAIRVVLRQRIAVADMRLMMSTADDLVWLALATTSKLGLRLVGTAATELDQDDESLCEQHWLSRYEMYRIGQLGASSLNSSERTWFAAAAALGLSFSTLK